MARLPSNPFEVGGGISKDSVDWNSFGYLTTDNGTAPDPFAQKKPGDGSTTDNNPFAPITPGTLKPGGGSVAYTRPGPDFNSGGFFEPYQPPPGYTENGGPTEVFQPPPPQDGGGQTDWANSLFNQNAQWGVQQYGNQRGWDALSAKGQWLNRLAPTLYNQYAVASAYNPNLNAVDFYNSLSPTIDNWWGVAQAANYAPTRRWR